MGFSQTEYDAVVAKINSGMNDIKDKVRQIVPAAEAGVDHWYVPGVVAGVVLGLADEAVQIATTLLDKLTELLEGVAAPVLFFFDAYGWSDVKGLASDVAGELDPMAMPSSRHWSGDAQQAYAKIIPDQAAAATRIGAVADSTATSLNVCAVAGLAFYVAIGAIVAQFVAALVGVIAALGSVAFSWAGVALAVGDTSISAGLIIAAVTALIGVLTAQAEQMVTLHGQVVDNSRFPGGKWPDPNTSSYDHAG